MLCEVIAIVLVQKSAANNSLFYAHSDYLPLDWKNPTGSGYNAISWVSCSHFFTRFAFSHLSQHSPIFVSHETSLSSETPAFAIVRSLRLSFWGLCSDWLR
jgi:hypothetical protein